MYLYTYMSTEIVWIRSWKRRLSKGWCWTVSSLRMHHKSGYSIVYYIYIYSHACHISY